MTITQESSTPPTSQPRHPDTAVYVSILVDARSGATVNDNHHPERDIVAVKFDDCGKATTVTLQGPLADVQRIVDDIAHQLMLVSTRRGHAEEELDARARGLAGVASLRDAAADARAERVSEKHSHALVDKAMDQGQAVSL